MSELFLTRELTAAGLEYGDVRGLERTGELERLRRGAYVGVAERTLVQKHRLLVEATMALAESDSVISFGSAAVMHELPVADDR